MANNHKSLQINDVKYIEDTFHHITTADIHISRTPQMEHILQDSRVIDIEENKIMGVINTSSVLEQEMPIKFQIKHGLPFVATWEPFFAFLSTHVRKMFI